MSWLSRRGAKDSSRRAGLVPLLGLADPPMSAPTSSCWPPGRSQPGGVTRGGTVRSHRCGYPSAAASRRTASSEHRLRLRRPKAGTGPAADRGRDLRHALRNLAIAVLKLGGAGNIAAACGHYARDATRTLATLGLGLA
jgi:hypothetical protein